MREIDVHDFHRRVIRNGDPEFAGLRAAAAVVTGDSSRATFSDWVTWQKLPANTARASFGDWTSWQKPSGDKSKASFSDWGVWTKVR
jgi:hypothetical protein